jgi:hypothetical protein
LNKYGRSVGQIVGDGVEVVFERPNLVTGTFTLCLLISNISEKVYPEMDFGSAGADYNFVTPLNISGISMITYGSDNRRSYTEIPLFDQNTTIFWCANVTLEMMHPDNQGTIRVFPILREKNYGGEIQYVSTETKVLMYILGCGYAIDFVLCLFCYISTVILKMTAIPLAFLCIFRIVFMFAYPNGVLYNHPLAEYTIFEIPTFLLFTVIIQTLGLWEKHVRTKVSSILEFLLSEFV